MKKISYSLCLLLVLSLSDALAAQLATVDIDNADLLIGPMANAAVVTHLKKGLKVTVSNYPVEGYYKIRTQGGTIGWIKSDKLVLGSAPASGGAVPAGKNAGSPSPGAPGRAAIGGKQNPEPIKTTSVPDFQLDTAPEIEVDE